MQIQQLAESFAQLEAESSRLSMTAILGDLLKSATADEARLIAYFSLGMIEPVYKATPSNIADKSMVKMLASLGGVSVSEVQQKFDLLGDLGLVAEQVLTRHVVRQHSIGSVVETDLVAVHAWLCKVQGVSGSGALEKKEQLVTAFLSQCEPLTARYLVRMLLGKLRLGFSDMTLLDACSFALVGDKSLRGELEDAYNVCVDIGLVVSTFKKYGAKGLEKIAMQPGIPVRPAAAERLASAAAIIEKLGPCIAQPKLDGFRLQVHVSRHDKKTEVHFFSRNLQDMSGMFPDLRDLVAQLPVQSCIMEGEAIAYAPDTGEFLPFQETVKRKRKHEIGKAAEEFPLKLFMFDVLQLDGESQLMLGQCARRAVLKKVFAHAVPAIKERVLPIEEKRITTSKELEDYFYANIASGLEGLVVKRLDAQYTPGKRNFNWIKLKRQETGSLDDTLDCVIIGYYFGQGKRAGFGIGALLVAVYNPELDCFQTVAKLGTGLTDQEWHEIKKECDARKAAHQPHNVQCAKELYPDAWVEPELVCMVRADEITFSPLHRAGASDGQQGMALRFPRMMGMRPDKAATDATTVAELAALCKRQRKV